MYTLDTGACTVLIRHYWITMRKLTSYYFSPHWRGFQFSFQDMRIIVGTLLLALCVQQSAAQNQGKQINSTIYLHNFINT